jgi:AcrR family transcriptional regulator
MIVYFRNMRIRDDKKQEALLRATIKVVNDIGFAASSVSKISKEAGVSPATLYVYFDNKDDLLVSTYLEIKQGMSTAMIEGLDETQPVHDIFHRVWHNTFVYVAENLEEFKYAEQFSNSPYSEQVDQLRVQESFESLLRVIQKGISQKIIKDVHLDILGAFLIHPIMVLANPNHCKSFEPTDENIEAAFRMAWDALRL